MAKKDVDNYFNEVVANYKEMIEALHDIESAANEGLINPDKLEEMKAAIEPLKQNYMRISYIMFLLNKPAKKKKENRYIGQNKKLLDRITEDASLDAVIDENTNVVSNMKKVIQ